MTQLASDNFHRADGAMGANWTFIGFAAFGIVSNQAAQASANVGLEFYSALSAPNDGYAEATVGSIVDTVSDQGVGPAYRSSTTTLTAYVVQANTHETKLYLVVTGGFTQLGSDGPAVATGDVLRITCNGTSISVQKNGTTIITVTDATLTTGNAGIFGAPSVVGPNISLFAFGNLTGGGAAALAGTATDAASATGALSTAIKLAAGATDAVSATAALLAQIKLAAAASSAVSATGSLQISPGLGGAALSAVTASGALTPFANVVLASPLYTGSGGLLDPNFWGNSNLPAVGDTIWYDPTFITILPNGEIVSTTNNCSGIVQFNDGSGWAVGLIVITPLMVGYAFDANTASGALSTAIKLASAATSLTTAAANLSTSVLLRGAASTLATATGALTTNIQLAAAALDTTSATGILPFGQAVLVGTGTDLTAATGALSTQIRLASAALDVVSAIADLNAQIQFAAQAVDLTIGSATFGVPQGAALQSDAFDFTTAQAFLGNQAAFTAAATDLTSAAGQITTAIQLLGVASDVTSAAAELGAQILFGFTPRLLTTAYFDPSLARIAGALPYAEFSERVGDQLAFAIDWTGWLAIRWVPGAMQAPGAIVRPTNASGFAYKTAAGGQSSALEPSWPASSGQTVNDGSIVWQCVAVDNTSLQATVSSAKWSAPKDLAILGQALKGQVTLVAVDLTAAIEGVNYAVNCEATFTDGQSKKGRLLIKVR